MYARLKDLFYIPKHGKVREKVVLTRIAVSIVCILFYLAAISITAYAYFSHSASTAVMTMSSAHYDLEITPYGDNAAAVTQEGKVYVLKNDTDGALSYGFELKRVQDSNIATVGFCTVKVKTDVTEPEVQVFYTQPIGTYLVEGKEVQTEPQTVTIKVPAGKTAYVTFVPELGSLSDTKEVIEGGAISPLYGETPTAPEPEAPTTDGTDQVTTSATATTEATTTATDTTATTTGTTEATTTGTTGGTETAVPSTSSTESTTSTTATATLQTDAVTQEDGNATATEETE